MTLSAFIHDTEQGYEVAASEGEFILAFQNAHRTEPKSLERKIPVNDFLFLICQGLDSAPGFLERVALVLLDGVGTHLGDVFKAVLGDFDGSVQRHGFNNHDD